LKVTLNFFLVLLAFAYLGIYGIQVMANPPEPMGSLLEGASLAINVVFILDFVLRLSKAKSKLSFLLANWIELVSLALPFVRALRVFRLLVAVNSLQRHLVSRQARAGATLALALPIVTVISALAILDVERDAAGSTITNFPLAIWWSIATMATVGDGNLSPVTWEGRVVATALMILGIGLFGAVAALFAATFINQPPRDAPVTDLEVA